MRPPIYEPKGKAKEAEDLCRKLGLNYYIKDSLRAEMEKT